MDSEIDGEEPSQRTQRLRQRRASLESSTSVGTPRKSSRADKSKLQPITEKEKKEKTNEKKVKKDKKGKTDNDDTSSVSSGPSNHSMKACSVVLEQLDMDDEMLLSSVPKTRSRKKSTLTEENLAAFSTGPSTTRRSKRSGSLVSEETTSTKPSTTLPPRRSTRRNSTAAPVAPATPKRELRTTRATSNSSEDVSVKSRSQKLKPETKAPQTPKRRTTSRLSQKPDSSGASDDISNVKKVIVKSELAAEEPPAQPLQPIEEDAYATPTGTAFTEGSVICIVDSDDDDGAAACAKPTEKLDQQNQTIELVSTMATVQTAVKETVGFAVTTKSRPSISKWPKSKLRTEEEEPMELDATVNEGDAAITEENTAITEEIAASSSEHTFARVAEIVASSIATESPDMFLANTSYSGQAELSATHPPSTVSVVKEQLEEAHGTHALAKIASPLKNTAELMGKASASEQAACPKAKPRVLSKSLDIAQDEQNADEGPISVQASPKISVCAIVETVEIPEKVISDISVVSVISGIVDGTIASDMPSEPRTENELLAQETPLAEEKRQHMVKSRASQGEQTLGATTYVESNNSAQPTVGVEVDENQPKTLEAEIMKMINETVQSVPITEQQAQATPAPVVDDVVAPTENSTQTPTPILETAAVQATEATVEETTQTPKSDKITRGVQTPKSDSMPELTVGMATPIPDADRSSKRQDTPYPDKDAVVTTTAKSDLEDHLKESREKLKNLSKSWNKSVKRNSVDALFIDGHGVQNKSGAGESTLPKEFVAARNRVLDSDNDSDEDFEDAKGELERPKNEFIDDEAYEAQNYESGDSMDSETRREHAENEIEDDGISLGSEDTELDGEDNTDDEDSFIVDEDDVSDVHTASEAEEFDPPVSNARPKFKRVIPLSESDSDAELIGEKIKPLVDAVLNGSKTAAAEIADNLQAEPVVTEDESVRIAMKSNFVVTEQLETISVAAEEGNPSLNKSGFVEIDNIEAESLPKSKPRNSSMMFVEEDATIENTSMAPVGKIGAGFIETKNELEAQATKAADEVAKETDNDVDQLNESDHDNSKDDSIHYSLNKSHPKIAEILKSALLHLLDDNVVSSSDDEQGEQQAAKDVPNSIAGNQDEQIGPMVLNSSASNANTNKSLQKTPKQGKENVSGNQSLSAVKNAISRSLEEGRSTSSALFSKQYSKTSANRSFGEVGTNQTLQVNPLSVHFDANVSNLLRSSTPNQKALLKTQQTAALPVENANNVSNESPARPGPSNVEKKSRKNASSENPLKTVNVENILDRCEAEILGSNEKKKQQKSQSEDDERQIEKKMKKKQKKEDKLAARAAAEESKAQQEAEKAAAARKRSKRLKKKRSESDGSVEFHEEEQPKTKKLKCLQILTTAGPFNESPMTPPRIQHGFVEEARTVTPRGYKVRNITPVVAQPAMKSKKRRLMLEEEPPTLLRKPKWVVENLFDGFEQKPSKKRQRTSHEIHIFNAGPTEFIVKQLDGKKRRKQPASSLIPAELLEFRKKNLYRKGIPRQDARTLLKQKEKMATNNRF